MRVKQLAVEVKLTNLTFNTNQQKIFPNMNIINDFKFFIFVLIFTKPHFEIEGTPLIKIKSKRLK